MAALCKPLRLVALIIAVLTFLYIALFVIFPTARYRIQNMLTFTARRTEIITDIYTFSKDCNMTVKTPDFAILNENWQPVENSSNSHHVYSAYHHNEDSVPIIRVIGNVYQPSMKKPLYCQLWYKNGSRSVTIAIVSAEVEPLPEAFNQRYRVSLFRCRLPDINVPAAVSVTSQLCLMSNNQLPVRSHVIYDKDRKKFAVCVAPLYGEYNLTRNLIPWIELNRILGADFFVFYNYSISRQTDRVLNFYSRKGLAKTVDWNISQFPPGSKDEMHYFGQHAAMNDCLMRVKNLSEFIVNLDLDELIVPHSNFKTWSDIIEHIPNHAGYMFLSSFFRLNWENIATDFPRKTIAEKYNLLPLFKLRRETKIFPPTVRSKYFSRTNVTEVIGTHLIFRMKPGYKIHTVPTEAGLLHHYRTIYATVNGTGMPDPVNNVPNVIDDTVYEKYRDIFIDNVIKVYSEMKATPLK